MTNAKQTLEPMFELGPVSMTPGAAAALDAEDVARALQRHSAGDWGNVSQGERDENEDAVEHCELFSSYRDRNGREFLVITRATAWETTVWLKADY